MNPKTDKVLIANRGEIAVRIMQACKDLGLSFVSVYTEEDKDSGHIIMARKLGGEAAVYKIRSYNDAGDILSVADETMCTAVHPDTDSFPRTSVLHAG